MLYKFPRRFPLKCLESWIMGCVQCMLKNRKCVSGYVYWPVYSSLTHELWSCDFCHSFWNGLRCMAPCEYAYTTTERSVGLGFTSYANKHTLAHTTYLTFKALPQNGNVWTQEISTGSVAAPGDLSCLWSAL